MARGATEGVQERPGPSRTYFWVPPSFQLGSFRVDLEALFAIVRLITNLYFLFDRFWNLLRATFLFHFGALWTKKSFNIASNFGGGSEVDFGGPWTPPRRENLDFHGELIFAGRPFRVRCSPSSISEAKMTSKWRSEAT